MPLRALTCIGLSYWFNYMKENEQWDGADVDKKTWAILVGLLTLSGLTSITTLQMYKPQWFEKIPKWDIGPTTLGMVDYFA